jgi:Uma2 family endonuclease
MTLGPDDHGRPVTAEEFAAAEFLEPWVYERERGRLVVMSPDGQRHIDGAQPWWRRLFAYAGGHEDIVAYVVPNAWVRVDGDTDRIGDIGVYLNTGGQVPPIPDRIPELMFEVVSPGRKSRDRDYVTKRRDYQRLGIREYVIIDNRKKQVTVLSHAEGAYEERVLKPGDNYTSALLPGLQIALSDVFA